MEPQQNLRFNSSPCRPYVDLSAVGGGGGGMVHRKNTTLAHLPLDRTARSARPPEGRQRRRSPRRRFLRVGGARACSGTLTLGFCTRQRETRKAKNTSNWSADRLTNKPSRLVVRTNTSCPYLFTTIFCKHVNIF